MAYVFIRMANSPRPGVWVLERSTDFGKTWNPWQFFADTPSDCYQFFEAAADEELYYDDQVLCTTEFSKVVPLEGGEVSISVVLLLLLFLHIFFLHNAGLHFNMFLTIQHVMPRKLV